MTLEERWKVWQQGIGALLFFLLVVPLMWWDAFVLVKLWGWFAVPLGATAFGVWQAVGLVTIYNHLRSRPNDAKDQEHVTSWLRIGHALISPATHLLIGYLIKTWAL